MNNIGMLTELELKDRLYTVRQQKRGATGNREVGFMYLIAIPGVYYGGKRIIPKLKNMLMVFCNCFILKKEEGNLFFKMGDLCKEIDRATEKIRGLNEQLEKLKNEEKQGNNEQ